MKKLFILLYVVSIGTINVYAQDSPVVQLKMKLYIYQTQCRLIDEYITSIENSSGNLFSMTEKDDEVAILVKRINNDIIKIYNKTHSLQENIKTLSDFLQTASPDDAHGGENKPIQEQPPVEDTKSSVKSAEQPPLEEYLSFPLSELSANGQEGLREKREEVIGRILSEGDNNRKSAYVAIFDLLEVQYAIYNATSVRNAIQQATSVKKEMLVGEQYGELQNEIARVRKYRYATIELQRLIKAVENPSEEIRDALGYGASGAGDSKWVDEEEKEIPATDVRDYLICQKETEYIDRYEYTKRQFDDFVEHPEQRKQIMADIENALK